MVSFLPFTSRRTGAVSAEGGGASPLKTGRKPASSTSPFSRFRQAAVEMTAGAAPSAHGQVVPGAGLPHVVLPVIEGGHVEIGAPTGTFVLVVVARGRVCPVSRNYVAALAELSPDLEALGVETIVISGSDGRGAAAAFGDAVKAAASTGAGAQGGGAAAGVSSSSPGSPAFSSHPLDDLPFKLAFGMTPEMMKAWGLYASAPRLPPPAPAGRGSASAAAAAAGEEEMTMTAPSLAGKATSSGQQQQLLSQQQRRAMPEPALFLLDADGQVVFADVSNSPFCRPDLALVIEGIRFVLETGYPTRGTLFFEE